MEKILVVGIGRMGKGIALAFAYAGYRVVLVDSEARAGPLFADLEEFTRKEIAEELQFLHETDVITARQVASIDERIRIVGKAQAAEPLSQADCVFEAVLEVMDVKQRVYAWLNEHIPDRAIVSSTTSTISANHLAAFVNRNERFINGHWLNPAHLMPLVEVSPGEHTSAQTVESLNSLLVGIGKVPVVCSASPGFIVARIQAVALNEAARLVEENVASAEDVDRAIKVGFGIRYVTLGMLEFIDWGGGDILFHATNYLGKNLDAQRFAVPGIVKENMRNQRNGLRDGVGFYDWKNCDLDDYRKQKLTEFVRLLQHRNLMPRPETIASPPAENFARNTEEQ